MGSPKVQKPHINGVAPSGGKRPNIVLRFLLKSFQITYGILVVFIYIIQMFRTNKKFRKMDANDKKDFALARTRLWDLSGEPFGLKHRICRLKNGFRLHYMLSQPRQNVPGKTGLVIFLHGFPDSWFIWHSLLKKANLKDNATLVAVDLPGHGGSSTFDKFDADSVLEGMTDFVLKMREQYLSQTETERGPVVIVGHDWGTVIGYRLASEASVLADRFILSNAPHPAHARANVESRLKTSTQIFKTWLHNPTNFTLLKRIYPNIKPVLNQLGKSGYIFAFILPWPLNTIIGLLGDFWFYRLINTLSTTSRPLEPIAGNQGWDMLASCVGPSWEQRDGVTSPDSSTPQEPQGYPRSAKLVSNGGFDRKIRLYREGLALDRWTKSLETLWELSQLEQTSNKPAAQLGGGRRRSVSRAGLFDIGPAGILKAPVTLLWGQKDLALEQTICCDGMTDYFGSQGSHVVALAKAGHWTTCDRQAVDIWEKIIHWSITGEKGGMKELLEGYPAANLVTSY